MPTPARGYVDHVGDTANALASGGNSGGRAFVNNMQITGMTLGPATFIRFSAMQSSIATQGNLADKGFVVTNHQQLYPPHSQGMRVIETLCRNTGLKSSALYANIELARTERDAERLPTL